MAHKGQGMGSGVCPVHLPYRDACLILYVVEVSGSSGAIPLPNGGCGHMWQEIKTTLIELAAWFLTFIFLVTILMLMGVIL